MTSISEKEIQEIVKRVVQRTVGGTAPDALLKSKPGESNQSQPLSQLSVPEKKAIKKSVAIGADHGGFDMKEMLKPYLVELGYEVVDCGTNDKKSVDYPDFALKVAQLVSEDKAWRGIMVDGAGIGSCMAANKVQGVRAAMCYDYATAVNSREHNDANVLTLGGGLIGNNLAKQIVSTWLSTEFGGERHMRRIEKIMAIEKKVQK
jgi:ribose 5-phosphate isomerase B